MPKETYTLLIELAADATVEFVAEDEYNSRSEI